MALYVTFLLASDSTAGRVEVRGTFNEQWGFTVQPGPSSTARFGSLGFPDNNKFLIDLKSNAGADHRFNLQFSTTDLDVEVVPISGNVVITELRAGLLEPLG